MTQDWYTERRAEAAAIAAQLQAKQQQIKDEYAARRRFEEEQAAAARAEQAKVEAARDAALAPRKAALRREYLLSHDGYDSGFEAFWQRVRDTEYAAYEEDLISRTAAEMQGRVWVPPSGPAMTRMTELGPTPEEA